MRIGMALDRRSRIKAKASTVKLYDGSAAGYDELYGAEQKVKHGIALRLLRPSGPVLDAGCGTGLLLSELGWHSVGLDMSLGMLERAKPRSRGELVLGDVEALPFRGASFEAVYSVTVMQLADDLAHAMGELAHAMRPGGRILVSVHRSTEARMRLVDVALAVGLDVISKVEPDGVNLDLMLLCERHQ